MIVHLATQAGVRYSLENPRAHLDSNVIGTFNVMEAARRLEDKHLLMASTSYVYGANAEMPFTETEKAGRQLTIYSATKKANESMVHAYAHLWNLPNHDVPLSYGLRHLGSTRFGALQIRRCDTC